MTLPAASSASDAASHVVGGTSLLPAGISSFASELAVHVFLAAVFAGVIGLVIRGHVSRAMKESLEAGIQDATKKLTEAFPVVASDFASIFRSAIHDGALPFFKEQVRFAAEGVIGELRTARQEIQVLIVEPKAPKEINKVAREAMAHQRGWPLRGSRKVITRLRSGEL
jgi:hypothetical protein